MSMISTRKFQNLLLLLSSLAVLAKGAANPKGRASSFFPRGSGVIMNLGESEFEQALSASDHMIFLYVFDSEQEKSK